jgi:hypothetical protein
VAVAQLILVRPMRAWLASAFAMVTTSLAQPPEKSIEVTLEDTPQQQPHAHVYRFAKPSPTPSTERPVRGQYDGYSSWRFRFLAAPDKQLGRRSDIAAIQSLLPPSSTRTIRWISRSTVVACADRTLYVFEKHHSKWQIVHHWPTHEIAFP